MAFADILGDIAAQQLSAGGISTGKDTVRKGLTKQQQAIIEEIQGRDFSSQRDFQNLLTREDRDAISAFSGRTDGGGRGFDDPNFTPDFRLQALVELAQGADLGTFGNDLQNKFVTPGSAFFQAKDIGLTTGRDADGTQLTQRLADLGLTTSATDTRAPLVPGSPTATLGGAQRRDGPGALQPGVSRLPFGVTAAQYTDLVGQGTIAHGAFDNVAFDNETRTSSFGIRGQSGNTGEPAPTASSNTRLPEGGKPAARKRRKSLEGAAGGALDQQVITRGLLGL
jgi:hypothetical protein